jgi:hypothetical protein
LPAGIVSPFNMHIQSGDASGGRISSGTVTLNGTQVAVPSDFSQQVGSLDRSVSLLSSNTLQVTVASKPGSFLIITFSGQAVPVANAGPAQTVFTGTTVQLDGTRSSDANGDSLTYQWSFTSVPTGSLATLTGATMPKPTFVVATPKEYPSASQGLTNGCPPLCIRIYQQRIHRIPCPMNGRHPLGHDWITRPLRCFLRLILHHSDLLQHAHEIVKEILFHDLALFVPMGNRTEVYAEGLVRGLNDRSTWHRHRTCHRSGEIRYSARPFALRQHDLVGIVDEVLVRKHLEECNRRLFMGIYAVGGRLIRPAHDAILGVGKAFEYFDKGIMAMIGRNAAVAEVGPRHHELTGPLAFAAWLGIHALLLTISRAKIDTFLEWAWDYFGNARVDPVLDRPDQMNMDWAFGEFPPRYDAATRTEHKKAS